MFKKLNVPTNEEEVTRTWKYIERVYVSVVCTTYNQDIYIRDAIDSFLAQETEFKFEIIIHDDLSKDSTRELLFEYQRKYPSIIKLILPEINQYSININMPFKNSLAVCEGEYVAICEGDDFWVDKYKLQKQFEVLRDNPDFNLCAHPAFILKSDGECIATDIHSNNISSIPTKNVVSSGGAFLQTNSLFIRASSIKNLPEWFYQTAPIGDYYVQVIASYPNGIMYIPDIMSIYRNESEGSFTKNILSDRFKLVYLNKSIVQHNHLCEQLLDNKSLVESFFNFNKCLIFSSVKLSGSYLNMIKVIFLFRSETFKFKFLISIFYSVKNKFLRKLK
ncbi:glycosyltransferase [Vibrio sp. 10N.261.51.A3]|uniref:glycosyltransferase n=1 Tax=Vibrio sp. 10N.261.51.A3 TaxID=3229673 RepID=UPI00354E7334